MRVSAFAGLAGCHLAVVPPVRGAGRAGPVQVERPTGRTTWTGPAWSARLVPGGRRGDRQAFHPSPVRRPGLVPPVTEPEDPAGGICFVTAPAAAPGGADMRQPSGNWAGRALGCRCRRTRCAASGPRCRAAGRPARSGWRRAGRSGCVVFGARHEPGDVASGELDRASARPGGLPGMGPAAAVAAWHHVLSGDNHGRGVKRCSSAMPVFPAAVHWQARRL